MNKPFFTVVIPTYNRADLLPLSIASVLEQSFPDFEIIVVDNCSTDNTPELMLNYKDDQRIHYFRNQENMERAYSRNVGLRNAKGSFLTLLDSDDIMYPHCLRDAHDFVASQPGTKVFHNLYEMVDQQGKPTVQKNLVPITNQHKQICQSNFLSCIGVFLAHEVYQKFLFTEDLKMIGSEDYEIWFRVLGYYEVKRINKVNCGVREHLGRSVYSNMYENLEYQRLQLLQVINNDPVLISKYKKYIGHINANYFYHEAMYSLHKNEKKQAWSQFCTTIIQGRGFIFSKRFFAFLKNYLLKKSSHEKNTDNRWLWIFRTPSWQKVK